MKYIGIIYTGFAIPKGSKIMICPYTVHLNPVVYKDPNTFNPWRWKVCEIHKELISI